MEQLIKDLVEYAQNGDVSGFFASLTASPRSTREWFCDLSK
jgi:hypothetical protein